MVMLLGAVVNKAVEPVEEATVTLTVTEVPASVVYVVGSTSASGSAPGSVMSTAAVMVRAAKSVARSTLTGADSAGSSPASYVCARRKS